MSVSDGAVTALLRAELGRLTPPQDTIAAIGDLAYHDAAVQVKLAIEAVLGGDVDEAAVRALTAILSAGPVSQGCAGTGRCCADWGDGLRCQHCTLAAGHDGNHIDGIGHAWAGPLGHAAAFVPADAGGIPAEVA